MSSYRRLLFMAFVAATLLLVAAPLGSVTHAAPPIPNYGSANVDGNPGEWTTLDYFADMYRSGNPLSDKLATLSLRFVCTGDPDPAKAAILYAYVDPIDGWRVIQQTNESYVRVNGINIVTDQSVDDGTPPDFAWVGASGGTAAGWEASGYIREGSYSLRVHTNVRQDGTTGSETADVADRSIPLTILCPPLAVDMESLAAYSRFGGVSVEWATASETDNLGFNVYRVAGKDTAGSLPVKVNSSLIPSQSPGGGVGASYEFKDSSVQIGRWYSYWAESVGMDGRTERHGPVSVFYGLSSARTSGAGLSTR